MLSQVTFRSYLKCIAQANNHEKQEQCYSYSNGTCESNHCKIFAQRMQIIVYSTAATSDQDRK